MRLRLPVWLFLLAMGSACWAQAPPGPVPPSMAPHAIASAPKSVKPREKIIIDARQSVSEKPLRWKVSDQSIQFVPATPEGGLANSLGIIFQAPDSGFLNITLIARGTPPGATEIDLDAIVLTIKVDDEPTPIPPTPIPVPPGPVPPGPTPPVPPSPTDRLQVLVLYESTDPATRDQTVALRSTTLRTWLSAHCAKGTDNLPLWRILDKDTDVSKEVDPSWKAAMDTAKADSMPLPKLVVFGAAGGPKCYPLKSEADALTTLQAFGGK